ncbi:cytochrome P450 [Peniophora sp. CONT]|nr:cytochrome P450 [Peniophora sp. CONT]
MSLFLIVSGLALASTAYVLHPLVHLVLALWLSPLARLPSPPSPSLLLGNLAAIADQENNDVMTNWTRIYGSTFTYRGFIGGRRLLTTDPLALNHILGHAYEYPKPEFVRASLSAMVAGEGGLLTVEGEVHRRQRKVLNQAFTVASIKSLYPLFHRKAVELRDVLFRATETLTPPTTPAFTLKGRKSGVVDSFTILRSLDPPAKPVSPVSASHLPPRQREASPGAVVDVLSYLSRATLDVIGEAGFGYQFNALSSPDQNDEKPSNELSAAFAVIFSTARQYRVLNIFQSWFPLLRRYQPNGASIKEAQETIRRVGTQLITERLEASPAEDSPRDLLSAIVRANDGIGKDALSQTDILSQISTFIAAGHETSASALTWTFYALARSPDEQTILRNAIRALPADASPDELIALPELDRVVREVLRLHAPVGQTMRVYDGSDPETAVPLARGVRVRRDTPWQLWRLPAALASFLSLRMLFGNAWALTLSACAILLFIRGSRRRVIKAEEERGAFDPREWTVEDHVRLRRGDIITIPIQMVNRDPAVWGEDAREFRPARWLNPPAAGVTASGLVPHTLTFLNGSPVNGNRACIGYRFAMAEIKIFLCVLLRDFEFSLDEGVVIEKRVNVVTRPFVVSSPELGNQMPLRLRRIP